MAGFQSSKEEGIGARTAIDIAGVHGYLAPSSNSGMASGYESQKLS